MKELNNQLQDKPMAAEHRPMHSQKWIGEIIPYPGHTVYQLNLYTGIIEEAPIEEVNATIGGGIRKKVIRQPGYLYVSALNVKNADRKFFKMIGLKYPQGFKPGMIKQDHK